MHSFYYSIPLPRIMHMLTPLFHPDYPSPPNPLHLNIKIKKLKNQSTIIKNIKRSPAHQSRSGENKCKPPMRLPYPANPTTLGPAMTNAEVAVQVVPTPAIEGAAQALPLEEGKLTAKREEKMKAAQVPPPLPPNQGGGSSTPQDVMTKTLIPVSSTSGVLGDRFADLEVAVSVCNSGVGAGRGFGTGALHMVFWGRFDPPVFYFHLWYFGLPAMWFVDGCVFVFFFLFFFSFGGDLVICVL